MTQLDAAPPAAHLTRSRTTTWDDPLAVAAAVAERDGLDAILAVARGELAPAPVARLLGLSVVDAEPGRVTFALDVGEHLYNPLGTVHGGIFATLLDTAMGCAVHTRLPRGTAYTTIDLSVTMVRALTTAVPVVQCIGEAVHVGRRIATAHGRIVDRDGTLYATGTTTCSVLS